MGYPAGGCEVAAWFWSQTGQSGSMATSRRSTLPHSRPPQGPSSALVSSLSAATKPPGGLPLRQRHAGRAAEERPRNERRIGKAPARRAGPGPRCDSAVRGRHVARVRHIEPRRPRPRSASAVRVFADPTTATPSPTKQRSALRQRGALRHHRSRNPCATASRRPR